MKFTIEQVIAEHKKVKSGADFPKFIQALKNLGVIHYTTYVENGNTIYFDINNCSTETGSKYELLSVLEILKLKQFKEKLKAHQKGETDYKTFCENCAEYGIKGWKVYLKEMTCTYFDKEEQYVLTENIPS